MSDNVDSAVAALKKLLAVYSPQERTKFAAEIAGCFAAGELTSVGANADKILSATTAEEMRTKLTPIQAANAGPNNLHLVKNVMARARRLGFTMKENERVDIHALDAALAGKSIEDRIALKTDMAKIGLL